MPKIRLVCISDTHNHAPGEGYTLPRGDVLIHAGDLTNQGTYAELEKAASWLVKTDFAVKIIIAGNHDISLNHIYPQTQLQSQQQAGKEQKETPTPLERFNAISSASSSRFLLENIPGAIFLEHSSTDIHVNGAKIRIFGSPYTPSRGSQGKWAFQYSDDNEAKEKWASIPLDTDILVTHSPPAGHCDESAHWAEGGCMALRRRVGEVKPVVHVCGHCHEGRGGEVVEWEEEKVRKWDDPGTGGNKKQSLMDLRALRRGKETAVVNCSIVARSWDGRSGKKKGMTFNKPVVVDMEFPGED